MNRKYPGDSRLANGANGLDPLVQAGSEVPPSHVAIPNKIKFAPRRNAEQFSFRLLILAWQKHQSIDVVDEDEVEREVGVLDVLSYNDLVAISTAGECRRMILAN